MSTRVRRKFSGPRGILTVSTFLYNLSLSFILGSFCPRRRSGCSPAEKSRFLCICSTGTAVPVPFRSLLFSPFISPFYGTAAFCSSLHFFTQTPQSCISKIRSFGGGALKKFALLRQQYRQKQYRSYIFLPRERNDTVIKLRSHFTSS